MTSRSDAYRSVSIERTGHGRFVATNARGGTVEFGTGEDADFTPVELLLVAMSGCSAIDVDYLTSRLAEPTEFTATAGGEKVRDEQGNHMGPMEIAFKVRFGEGEGADKARDRLPDAVAKSRDRLCTVARTVQVGSEIEYTVE